MNYSVKYPGGYARQGFDWNYMANPTVISIAVSGLVDPTNTAYEGTNYIRSGLAIAKVGGVYVPGTTANLTGFVGFIWEPKDLTGYNETEYDHATICINGIIDFTKIPNGSTLKANITAATNWTEGVWADFANI